MLLSLYAALVRGAGWRRLLMSSGRNLFWLFARCVALRLWSDNLLYKQRASTKIRPCGPVSRRRPFLTLGFVSFRPPWAPRRGPYTNSPVSLARRPIAPLGPHSASQEANQAPIPLGQLPSPLLHSGSASEATPVRPSVRSALQSAGPKGVFKPQALVGPIEGRS